MTQLGSTSIYICITAENRVGESFKLSLSSHFLLAKSYLYHSPIHTIPLHTHTPTITSAFRPTKTMPQTPPEIQTVPPFMVTLSVQTDLLQIPHSVSHPASLPQKLVIRFRLVCRTHNPYPLPFLRPMFNCGVTMTHNVCHYIDPRSCTHNSIWSICWPLMYGLNVLLVLARTH